MSKLSQDVSTILNYHIPEGKWKQQLERIDKSGEPTQKHMTAILFTLCETVESLQNELEDKHAPKRS